MPTTKPWYLSAGVWGALLSVLASALALFKVRHDAALLRDVSDWLLQLSTLAGGAVALYGRVRASRRITLVSRDDRDPNDNPAAPKQNWQMNAAGPLALLVLPALLSAAPGCRSGAAAFQLPSPDYVAADRATYEAVAPEYSAYVHNDSTLDDDERSRRDRTLLSWRERVEAAEAARAGGPESSKPQPLSSKQPETPKGQEETEEDDSDLSRF